MQITGPNTFSSFLWTLVVKNKIQLWIVLTGLSKICPHRIVGNMSSLDCPKYVLTGLGPYIGPYRDALFSSVGCPI